jgi:RNA polymerase sigma-70 factor (ECF subfamily)
MSSRVLLDRDKESVKSHAMEVSVVRAALPALLPALRAYGRTLARNASTADDLVQEAVMKAMASEAQFQPGTDLRAWVFTILRNVWLGQIRRAGRERRALDGQDHSESRPPNQADRMELANLARAMEALPVSYREALMLVGAHGMTTLQAAAVVGVAEGTIKARVSRARKALRLVMPQGPDGHPGGRAEDAEPPTATRDARSGQPLATAGEGADDDGTGGHPTN